MRPNKLLERHGGSSCPSQIVGAGKRAIAVISTVARIHVPFVIRGRIDADASRNPPNLTVKLEGKAMDLAAAKLPIKTKFATRFGQEKSA